MIGILVPAIENPSIDAGSIEEPQIRTARFSADIPLKPAPVAGITKAHAHGTSS